MSSPGSSYQNLIAYFSAEYGLSSKLPIYAGGLGVLSADILRQANDSDLPLVGVGLFYQAGYSSQEIDELGRQVDRELDIKPEEAGLTRVLDSATHDPLTLTINLPAEPCVVSVWQKKIGEVSLYLLDAAVSDNEPWEQTYTSRLYLTGRVLHMAQDFLLGVGGVRLMRRLNLPIRIWHINDDHPALAFLELVREEISKGASLDAAIQKVKNTTVFTTHTPVSGAESFFSVDFIWPYLETLFKELPVGKDKLLGLGGVGLSNRDSFSFSVLALNLAGKINAVSQRHQVVARKLWHFVFPDKKESEVPIDYVTNAVHARTWMAKPMDEFYHRYLGTDYESQIDKPMLWTKLASLGKDEKMTQDLWQARLRCKQNLITAARERLKEPFRSRLTLHLNANTLFLGFARRFALYKRMGLLLSDLPRLARILTHPTRPAYFFVAGKAHPQDEKGKLLLEAMVRASLDPILQGRLIFLPDYDIELAKVLTAGVDLWLNTPLPPQEAAGTSGMKALYNGVLNLSISDGWWYEAGNQEVGWILGSADPDLDHLPTDKEVAEELYNLLAQEVIPLYYQRGERWPHAWISKIRESLLQLAPEFNTLRLLKEYEEKLWRVKI